MPTRLLITLLILISSCSSDNYLDNAVMMDTINALSITQIITEVEVDTLGNTKKTLSVEEAKFDSLDRLRFTRKTVWFDSTSYVIEQYYSPNKDVFYQVTTDTSIQFRDVFEAYSDQQGRLQAASQIFRTSEGLDTIEMRYDYTYYPNGDQQQLLLHVYMGDSLAVLAVGE